MANYNSVERRIQFNGKNYRVSVTNDSGNASYKVIKGDLADAQKFRDKTDKKKKGLKFKSKEIVKRAYNRKAVPKISKIKSIDASKVFGEETTKGSGKFAIIVSDDVSILKNIINSL